VTKGPGDGYIVGWFDDDRRLHSLKTSNLPPHHNPDLVQRALDLFAQRRALATCERVCGTCRLYEGNLGPQFCRLEGTFRTALDRCCDWMPGKEHP
jgi:hypothetical protein